MKAWVERRCGSAIVAAALLVARGTSAHAQVQGSLFERLNLDRLRLTALGVGVGVVKPSRLQGTNAYSLYSDYGEIVPRWSVVFGATYWKSEYKKNYLEEFADTVEKSLLPDTVSLEIGRVTLSDIALSTDLRWSPFAGATALRPYVGGSLGVHVLNAEGGLIRGTFIESALDNITAGIGGVAGLDILLFKRILVGGQVRYDLLTGARFGSARVVGSYLFSSPRRVEPSR